MAEGATGERRRRRGITRVTDCAIARRRHVVRDFPGCSRPIMTGRTGQSFVYACQGRVVETGGETAPRLMTILAGGIRQTRMSRSSSADWFCLLVVLVTANARLRLNGGILMVDRCSFQEFTRRSMTNIAIPTVRIGGGVCRSEWGSLALGFVGRIIVGTNVARTATSRESRM